MKAKLETTHYQINIEVRALREMEDKRKNFF